MLSSCTTNTAFPNDPRLLTARRHPPEEPDAELYIQAISRAPRCRISAGNFIELSIVVESQFGVEVAQQCDALFRRIGIVINP